MCSGPAADGAVSRAALAMLARLIEQPGSFVPVEALARAAGVRSASRNVVRVHICHLRHALVSHGLPAGAIQTGPNKSASYRLCLAAAPLLLPLVASDRRDAS